MFKKLCTHNIFTMNKYKILFACNAYPPSLGGAEKVCKRMVEILSKEGEVTVLTQYHPDRKDKTRIVELPSSTSYSYMPKLKEYLNTHDFDLYISFGYGKYFTDTIGSWTRRHKKPSVVMPCGFFHTNQRSPFKVLYAMTMTKRSLNNYTIRVTATEWEKEFWHRKFGVTNLNSFVIPYNLEPDFTKFKETNILKKKKLKSKEYILYIGRSGPNKLIQLLIDAYNKTDKKLPLVIAGKGNQDFNYLPRTDVFLETYTDEDIARMKTNFNILSMGTISEDDKKTLIKSAKLCIFPSSFESFGMVLLESLALKTPTIGSNIGPFKEILQKDSLLFENNINALARKISRVYEDDYETPPINLPNQETMLRGLVFGLKHKILPTRDGLLQSLMLQFCYDGVLKEQRSQADEGLIVWVAILVLILVIGFGFFLQYFKEFIKWLQQVVFK